VDTAAVGRPRCAESRGPAAQELGDDRFGREKRQVPEKLRDQRQTQREPAVRRQRIHAGRRRLHLAENAEGVAESVLQAGKTNGRVRG